MLRINWSAQRAKTCPKTCPATVYARPSVSHSDFIYANRDAWSQDVVLRAMCEAVSRSAFNHAADSSGERQRRPPRMNRAVLIAEAGPRSPEESAAWLKALLETASHIARSTTSCDHASRSRR